MSTCTICKRRAGNLTLTLDDGTEHHVCSNVACVASIQAIGKQREPLDAIEKQAVTDGLQAFGLALKDAGSFDMRTLSKEAMIESLERFLEAYAQSMQTRIINRVAPF